MARVARGDRADAGLAGALDRSLHGDVGDDLAKPGVAVDDRDAERFPDDPHVRARIGAPALHAAGVAGQRVDAVGVDVAQVGLDQRFGHDPRAVLGQAELVADRDDVAFEVVGLDEGLLRDSH